MLLVSIDPGLSVAVAAEAAKDEISDHDDLVSKASASAQYYSVSAHHRSLARAMMKLDGAEGSEACFLSGQRLAW